MSRAPAAENNGITAVRPLLTDDETAALLVWLTMSRGGFDLEESAALIGWARQTRRAAWVLEQVIRGERVDLAPGILPPARRRRGLELVQTTTRTGTAG